MIARATAIPLAIHPYSTTSHVVHWLTRHQGKIATILKGALRPKSPFLGEYELFSTSELLFFEKKTNTLHTAKECALLTRRVAFRSNWRATSSASYVTSLIHRTTPEEAPMPDLFELYEDMLDHAVTCGAHPYFPLWAELVLCQYHGHPPNLSRCVSCGSRPQPRFCIPLGGLVCDHCADAKELTTLPCDDETQTSLRVWSRSDHPEPVINTALSAKTLNQITAILGAFTRYHFNLRPEPRNAVMEAA